MVTKSKDRTTISINTDLVAALCQHTLYMSDMDRRGALFQEGTAAYGRYPPTYSAAGSALLPPASNVANGRKRMLLLLNRLFWGHVLVGEWAVSSPASTESNTSTVEHRHDEHLRSINSYIPVLILILMMRWRRQWRWRVIHFNILYLIFHKYFVWFPRNSTLGICWNFFPLLIEHSKIKGGLPHLTQKNTIKCELKF